VEAHDTRVQIARQVDHVSRWLSGYEIDLLEWAEQILPYRKTKPPPPVNDLGLVRLVEEIVRRVDVLRELSEQWKVLEDGGDAAEIMRRLDELRELTAKWDAEDEETPEAAH
jgi:hypothetical protein